MSNVKKFLNNSAGESGHAGDDCSRLDLSKGKSTKVGSFSKLTAVTQLLFFTKPKLFSRQTREKLFFPYFSRKQKVLL